MVGDGPDCEHAFAVAADLGVATRVEHRGVVDDLERMLPKADLFLSASETESFGLSMLEAMSCGVPCVSTAVGGVEEVLGDTGVLTPFGEPDAMAAAALRLLTDPAEHARRSRAARSRAIARFSADDVIARYVRIYERILQ
jgi:glycosyltransferase involved in cell wall biosynthesis